jgi:phosphomannomutase/phosphoglucomutase
MITPDIFRAYDIRGVFNEDFDSKGAEEIGQAYGTYLLRNSSKDSYLRVCVGKDGRSSGEEVKNFFIKGLLKTGIEVTDLDLLFTPLLYYSGVKGKFDGAVMVTASHNPAEYNGFKFQGENSHALFGNQIQEIFQIIEEKDFVFGEEKEILKDNYYLEYQKLMKKKFKSSKKTKIVIDAGNGVMGKFAPIIFEKLGFEVVKLYCEIDGSFPNHLANPEEEETLTDLRNLVVKEKADFGIAFDGDGDRFGIVDFRGKIFTADNLLVLFIKDLLERNKGAKVVYNVSTSLIVKDTIEKMGGIPIESKVGHSYIELSMRENQALLGGENSGHFFFAEDYFGYDDALFASLKLLNFLEKKDKSLEDLLLGIPKLFTSPEHKIPVKDTEKEKIMNILKQKLAKDYKLNLIDGIKFFFNKTDWGIIRPSNTCPEIKFRLETNDKNKLNDYINFFQNLIEDTKKEV